MRANVRRSMHRATENQNLRPVRAKSWRSPESRIADSPMSAAANSFPRDSEPATSTDLHLQPVTMQPTQALQRSVKRLTLTTKQTGKGFYKGTGSGSMGNHTKYGTYKIQWSKVRTYVAPDLSSFEVKPVLQISVLSVC